MHDRLQLQEQHHDPVPTVHFQEMLRSSAVRVARIAAARRCHAAITSERPLRDSAAGHRIRVKPNIMFTLDDSGQHGVGLSSGVDRRATSRFRCRCSQAGSCVLLSQQPALRELPFAPAGRVVAIGGSFAALHTDRSADPQQRFQQALLLTRHYLQPGQAGRWHASSCEGTSTGCAGP